jgi:hypothetical protein
VALIDRPDSPVFPAEAPNSGNNLVPVRHLEEGRLMGCRRTLARRGGRICNPSHRGFQPARLAQLRQREMAGHPPPRELFAMFFGKFIRDMLSRLLTFLSRLIRTNAFGMPAA